MAKPRKSSKRTGLLNHLFLPILAVCNLFVVCFETRTIDWSPTDTVLWNEYLSPPRVLNATLNVMTKIPRNKNLLVINALGRNETMHYSVLAKRAHFQDWNCIAFLYATEDVIPDNHEELLKLRQEYCAIVRTPNVYWGVFLQYLSPVLVWQYEHIAILLDDVLLPTKGERKVQVPKLLNQIWEHNLTSITPAIHGDSHKQLRPTNSKYSGKGCLVEVEFIETFFQIFTIEGWNCFYSMLHYTGGRGWCYDICFKPICPGTKLAVDFSQEAWHLENSNADVAMLSESVPRNSSEIREGEGGMYTLKNRYGDLTRLCRAFGCSQLDKSVHPLNCPVIDSTN